MEETKLQKSFDRTLEFFARRVEKYGISYRTGDYGSRQSQSIRYQVTLEAISSRLGMRVLDVGCGVCDFYDFLLKRQPGIEYVGIDMVPEVIEVARKAYPNLEIRNCNVLGDDPILEEGAFDLVVAHGIFYRLDSAEPTMQAIIKRLYWLSRSTVVFNSLSSWGPPEQIEREPDRYYADPLKVVGWCKDLLTRRLVLRHDYMPHDFTIYLYKGSLP